jgi:hypothetical protein
MPPARQRPVLQTTGVALQYVLHSNRMPALVTPIILFMSEAPPPSPPPLLPLPLPLSSPPPPSPSPTTSADRASFVAESSLGY